MPRKYREKDFPDKEYDEFYEDHFFAPLDDQTAINAHRVFPRVAWALDVAREVRPRNILDLGCLEGYAVLTLLNNLKGRPNGFGVDLSKDGIQMAKKRAKQFKLNAMFEQGTIEAFLENARFQNHTFDFIMLFEVIEHVEDPVGLLKMIDRVKTRDGTVLISTPAFESPTYGMDDEQNKCHVRLYTTADEDYEAVNSHGNKRKATSITKQVGKSRIKELEVISELINCRYT